MSKRLNVGDKVRVKSDVPGFYDEHVYAGQELTVLEVEDDYYSGDMTYYVQASDGAKFWPYDENLDIEGALAVPAGVVTLTKEQATQVREALEALGWTEDDLGPLAVPKRYGKANVEFPNDEFYYQALEALEDTARKWGGTITF